MLKSIDLPKKIGVRYIQKTKFLGKVKRMKNKNDRLIRARGVRTQQEMADLCNVAQQTYSNWENGYIPPLRKMLVLEMVTGISKEELFFEFFNLKNRFNEQTITRESA